MATENTLRGLADRRRIAARIADFLEYLLMLAVLLECNSMYCYAVETVGRVDMYMLFYRLSMGLAAAALAIRLWLNPKPLRRCLEELAPFGLLIVWAVAFYLLNVRLQEAWKRQSYVMNFLLFLPLMTALFKAKQRDGQGLDLLLKYSDIVCVLAALSLAVYLASVLRPESVQADLIYSRWNNRRATTAQLNLLDVCQAVLRAKWQMLGVSLLRNRSLFTEPLMFALPLLISLNAELFLRDEHDRWRVLRWALLSVALLVVNATIGLMLAAVAWGLKAVSACLTHRRRWLVIPMLVLAVGVVAFMFLEKGRSSYLNTAISGSSMSDHLDDYSASFKAFATSPWLGVGFLNEEGIFAHMQAFRLNNPGLSNTAGTVLAEGGAMLGLMCALPFFVCCLYLFRRRNWRVACWAVGMLGAAVGIIFKYHLLLMLLIAFGYSLLEVRREGGRLRLALADVRDRQAEPKADKAGKWLPVLAAALGIGLVNGALALFGAPVWSALRAFLRGHQFSVGQSPLRAFCLAIALLLNGVGVRRALRGEASWARVAGLLAWDAAYLLLYPALFSWVNTLLPMLGLWGELRECVLLLAAWMLPTALLLLWPARRLNRRNAAALGATAAVIAAIVCAGSLYIDRHAGAEDALAAELNELTQCATGSVYVNDMPLKYRRLAKGLALPATRDSGYEVEENATVVFEAGAERRELMEYGFQVARLQDGHLVYTTDPAVIARLAERGTAVYRYYPFGREVDLASLAELNALQVTDEGAVIVDGPIESLASGPYDTLYPGEYSAVYALHIDPERRSELPADATVCRAALTWDYGQSSLAQHPVALDAFDANGDAEVSVPFALVGIADGVEYQLFGEADVRVEVRSIDVRQTPSYITVTDYNSHRDVIRESYFNLDGTPCDMGGYAVLEQEFDMADRLIAQRFCDADRNPVLVRSGYAELRYTHNAKGSPDSESYMGTDGKPIMIAYGYASQHWEYDAYGNIAVTRYYDVNGDPVNNAAGYAVLVREYDDQRQIVRQEYLDTDGNAVEPAS